MQDGAALEDVRLRLPSDLPPTEVTPDHEHPLEVSMYKIVYHQVDGSTQTVELSEPTTVMQAAIQNDIDGIIGECGGQAMCATCHVYVRSEYLDQLPEKSQDELEMLEAAAAELHPERSRLGCQIIVGKHLDEIEVDVPETQI